MYFSIFFKMSGLFQHHSFDFYFRLFLNNGKSRFTLTTYTIENGNMRLESIT